jgi:large subunit ribosomal protein L10
VVFAGEVRSSARILTDFAKGHDKLNIKFSVLRGQVVEGKEAAAELAKLPSREELLSRILGLINQPAAMLLAQINAPGQQLASVVQAWLDKRKEAGEGAAAAVTASEGSADSGGAASTASEGSADSGGAASEGSADSGGAA